MNDNETDTKDRVDAHIRQTVNSIRKLAGRDFKDGPFYYFLTNIIKDRENDLSLLNLEGLNYRSQYYICAHAAVVMTVDDFYEHHEIPISDNPEDAMQHYKLNLMTVISALSEQIVALENHGIELLMQRDIELGARVNG